MWKICRECGKKFETNNKTKISCSLSCSRKFNRKKYNDINDTDINLTRNESGMLGELIVMQDLVRKGWNVYKAISGSAPVDLVAFKGDVIYKIEVKLGEMSASGYVNFPKPRNLEYDLVAIAFRNGKVLYIPRISLNTFQRFTEARWIADGIQI